MPILVMQRVMGFQEPLQPLQAMRELLLLAMCGLRELLMLA